MPNKVLGHPAPDINPQEKTLPREARTTLAQLRSGYSTTLKSYINRIEDGVDDTCPDCNMPGHTTTHLFDCAARPTTLTTAHLWEDPVEAAHFLGLTKGGDRGIT